MVFEKMISGKQFSAKLWEEGMMELHNVISTSERSGSIVLTVDMREVRDEGETYFVAECLELPGCVSQGSTSEEARANIEDAMRACISVIVEDCFAKMMQKPKPRESNTVRDHFLVNVNTVSQLEFA